MDKFIAQLNQLLTSSDEDGWFAGLCDLLESCLRAQVTLLVPMGKKLAVEMALGNDGYKLVRPIISGEAVIGQLMACRKEAPFTVEEEQVLDIALCLCTALLRKEKKQAAITRKKRVEAVREAINALSFAELETVVHISQEIKNLEGRLIAGHIADMLGFTRSTVVNALKKLEGAGMIETRSLGVKGTYIKIREPFLVDELKKLGR